MTEINHSECQAVAGTRYGPHRALIGLAGMGVRDVEEGWLTIQSIGKRYVLVLLQNSVQRDELEKS
jgi:hypothetical protein